MMDILDATLDRVVKNQIEGQRGGVGVLLSGGVDSTMIAAMATKHAEIQGYNFSFWSEDSVLDERRNAEKVAAKLGFPLQSISFDGETYRSELARALWLFETPLWHLQAVAVHLLARRAFADGIRILLSGVSLGPLLLAALDRYRYILPPPFVSHIPPGVLRVARKVVYSANGLPVAAPFFAHNLAFGVRLIDGGKRARMVARMNETYEFVSDLNERRIQVMRMSDNAFFWPRFFRQGDSLCMGESVEYCDAAIDSDFMSLALNLNNRLILRKNKTTKWILKELATRYVPRELAFQKKPPVWSVPVDKYFVPMLRESLFKGGFLESHMGMDWQAVNDAYKQDKEKTQILDPAHQHRSVGADVLPGGSRSTTFRPCSSKRTYGPGNPRQARSGFFSANGFRSCTISSLCRGKCPASTDALTLTAISRLRDPRRLAGDNGLTTRKRRPRDWLAYRPDTGKNASSQNRGARCTRHGREHRYLRR